MSSVAILPRMERTYMCLNCKAFQKITTNHEEMCLDYCKSCSWKPSFGKAEYAIPMFGHTYRPFVFAGHMNPREHRENLSLPRWALAMEGKSSSIVSIGIVTNENPDRELAMDRETVNRQLFKSWIRRMNLSYEEIVGSYGTIEHPALIYNCTRAQLIELARECYQKAVIFGSQLARGMRWEWIEYRDAAADYVTTERRYEWEFALGAEDYFSAIKHRKFKIPFFDSERRALPTRSRYGKPGSLYESLRRLS
jgi:hypothetical protein